MLMTPPGTGTPPNDAPRDGTGHPDDPGTLSPPTGQLRDVFSSYELEQIYHDRKWDTREISPLFCEVQHFADEFFLKADSLWLADPERMKERFREQAQLHQDQLEQYERALQLKQLASHAGPENADVCGLNEVLYRYVTGYEHNYLAWCQSMLQYLEQQINQPREEEDQA